MYMLLEILVSILFAGALGASFGSFANVLAIRWHEGSSLLGRSSCPGCKRVIKPHHLVPVFSWLWLRGKCAYCQKKIHAQYPLVEAVGAAIGIISALRFSPFLPETAPHFWFELLMLCAMLVPLVMDIRWKEVPVEFLGGVGLLGGLWNLAGFGILSGNEPFAARIVSLLLALALAVLFFGGQNILSRGRWLGLGDVWLGAAMAAILGWPLIAAAVYLSYVLGGSIAAVGLLSHRLRRGDRLPFAPALIAGFALALWYGPFILAWFHAAFA